MLDARVSCASESELGNDIFYYDVCFIFFIRAIIVSVSVLLFSTEVFFLYVELGWAPLLS